MIQRTFLHFDTKSKSWWDLLLAFLRIWPLPGGIPNDAVTTNAELTIYGGNYPETLAQRIAKKAREKFGYTCFNGFCTIVVTEEQLADLIAAEIEERDVKIRRVILAGTKVLCGECCGAGWIKQFPHQEVCSFCEGFGEVLSEEAEEVLALLEGGNVKMEKIRECINGTGLAGSRGNELAVHARTELFVLEEAMKGLISLTPGGSEYVDDPARCVAFVHRKEEGLMKAMKRFKDRADKARLRALEECLAIVRGPMADSIADITFNEPDWDAAGDIRDLIKQTKEEK